MKCKLCETPIKSLQDDGTKFENGDYVCRLCLEKLYLQYSAIVAGELDAECSSCCEQMPKNECPNSKRVCGHHCNCSWTQDQCCWCKKEFGEEDEAA